MRQNICLLFSHARGLWAASRNLELQLLEACPQLAEP